MTVTKMDIAPTPRVPITVLVTLDTQAMEYHVPVRDVYYTQELSLHGYKYVCRNMALFNTNQAL